MDFNYIKYKEEHNIVAHSLTNKELYYQDLNNIEWSHTGRYDAMFSNTFFSEAVQLIINAIVLFEKGYFDCAIYSLRQSIEISTTSIYFSDDIEESRKTGMTQWRNNERFPQLNQMLKQLVKRRNVFAEVKEKMPDFFADVEMIKQKMNKYVHKQGVDKFYTIRGRRYAQTIEKRCADFEYFLVKTIGAVGLFRLIIDPFPLLLSDEDIYKRTGQFITESYDLAFVKKYIGSENIEKYKSTNFYKNHYDELIKGEELIPAVIDLVKEDYIVREKCEEILTQKHLLGKNDLVAVAMAMFSDKITKIFDSEGYHWYMTNISSLREKMDFSTEIFDSFIGQKPIFNFHYDNVFLSSVKFGADEYFLQHNYSFEETEIQYLQALMEFTDINNLKAENNTPQT